MIRTRLVGYRAHESGIGGNVVITTLFVGLVVAVTTVQTATA
jgi:hypothetical protein